MGGKSTSHKAVLSGKKTSKSSGFDLHSWQGLTQVLKKGKDSLKDADSYAEFRNLVLEYAQGGGDAEIRKQIDSVIASFGEEKTTPQEETSSSKKRRNRKRKNKTSETDTHVTEETPRNDMRKEAQAPVQSKVPQPPTSLPVEQKKAPEPQAPPVQSATPPAPKPAPVPTSPTPKPAPKPVYRPEPTPPAPKPVPVPQQTPQEVKTDPDKAPETPVVNAPEATSETGQGSFKSLDEHKARIVEIKRLVHENIGNPAALMSSHNDVGKKYMMALLAALKSTGPGSSESPDGAMRRLEEAYKTLIENPTSSEVSEKTAPKEVPTQTKTEPVEPKPVTPPEPARPTPVEQKKVPEPQAPPVQSATPPAPKPAPVPTSPTPKPAPKPVYRPEPTPPAPKPVPVPKTEKTPELLVSVQEKQKIVESEPEPLKEKSPTKPVEIKIHAQTKKEITQEEIFDSEDSEAKLSPISTLKALLREDESGTSKEQTNKTTQESNKVKLGKDRTPPDTDVYPSQREAIRHTKHTKKEVGNNINSGYRPVDAVNPVKVAVKQTELSSPKVSEALNQLLHEWNLFKSSGLLGIGPSGSEHPLYQKLASLSMGEVVSGRWEGSDRKATKAIKEYVDAWRHEQGVAYNIQETFDHYLRRVVLRIQQRQTEGK